MGERIDLIAADQAQPGTTFYRPTALHLDWENARIKVILKGDHGEYKSVVYENALMELKALNTANFTTNSLHKRLLQKLLTDGHLAGNIAGVPDA